MKTEGKFNDHVTVIDVVKPQSITAGATGVLTAAIDMSKYSKIFCVISTGVLGSAATLDASVTASATSGGTYAALTGKALTQIAKASGDNKVYTIEVDQEAVREAGKAFAKLHLVVGTADSIAGAVVLGLPRNYGAASALNCTITEAK